MRPHCHSRGAASVSDFRHEHQEWLDRARAQARSPAAIRDRQRRKALMEGSFADAANNHGFKRARWRRLWRQQIQDFLIAGIQNIRILLRRAIPKPAQALALAVRGLQRLEVRFRSIWAGCSSQDWLAARSLS